MRRFTQATLAALGTLAIAAPALTQFGGPPPPPNTGVALYAPLRGAVGAGAATVVIDPPKGTVCYLVNVGALANATAAHIHVGGPGENGRVAVPFDAPDGGTTGGCAPIAADLAAAILANPGGYYVNVHTQTQPAGAIRGQLAQ